VVDVTVFDQRVVRGVWKGMVRLVLFVDKVVDKVARCVVSAQ
jgi:hypothetical protein